MVRLRGVSVHAIAQLDVRRLPEFTTASAFDKKDHIAACYILIRPGSQLWLEYSIDGPHPEKAIYFFKLTFENQVITSWDCTEKHHYRGKVAYSLHTIKTADAGGRAVVQNAFRFSATDEQDPPSPNEDCMELRVYRVQHRRRLRDLPLDCLIPKLRGNRKALRIIENGLIEDHRPARRYQYQLLDAKDVPFVTFRFFLRTRSFLDRHQLFCPDRSSSLTSTTTSGSQYLDAMSSPIVVNEDVSSSEQCHGASPNHRKTTISSEDEEQHTNHKTATGADDSSSCDARTRLPRSTSDSSVASKIRDSIEDLPSLVPRTIPPNGPALSHFRRDTNKTEERASTSSSLSSQLQSRFRIFPSSRNSSTCHAQQQEGEKVPLLQPALPATTTIAPQIQTSPSRLPFQRHRRHRPDLPVNVDDGNNNTASSGNEPKIVKTRPLSPFTQGGFLRRLVSSPEPMTTSTSTTATTYTGLSGLRRKARYSSEMDEKQQGFGSEAETSTKAANESGSALSLRTFLSKKFERRCVT